MSMGEDENAKPIVCLPPGTGRNRMMMANVAFYFLIIAASFVLFATVFIPGAAEAFNEANIVIVSIFGAATSPIISYYVGKAKINAAGFE